jgi:hypothetical protein
MRAIVLGVLLLICAAPVFVAAPAAADCMSICLSGHGSCELDEEAGRSSSYCTIEKNDCMAECRNSGNQQKSAPAGPPVMFGALAYGFTSHQWAESHAYSSEAEAEKVALATCAKSAKDCRVMGFMRNNCGALGVGDVSWGYGVRDKMQDAKNDALQLCKKGGSKDCSIVVSQCSQ